ncbi:MAG TPA: NAD-dependent epimerase/dehydratase family protein [Gaiellaceae bacterium]|nr:NAD-dependent epimerase/dehydratase family protein [Gaiellaceae bacterium]
MTAEAFSGRRVLITGGLGFIGSNLARRLVEAGAEVLLVDSMIPEYGGSVANIAGIEDDVTVNIADVRDVHSLPYLVGDCEVIFSLAGQTSHLDSMADPYTDLEINCRAQLSLLEACRLVNPGARIVFASTRQIYGRPEYLPVDERHPINPVDVNGINKTAGEWYHLLYGRVYGIPVCVLRLTNTYGPRMRVKDARQTFLGYWLRQIVAGEEIAVFGDGLQKRDFNYVDDAVDAFLLAAARDEAIGKIYNLGDSEVVSLLDLAQKLVGLNGEGSFKVVPFPEDRKAIDIGDYYSDFTRIKDDLGWQPQIGLDEGLRRSIDFYREHGSVYWP